MVSKLRSFFEENVIRDVRRLHARQIRQEIGGEMTFLQCVRIISDDLRFLLLDQICYVQAHPTLLNTHFSSFVITLLQCLPHLNWDLYRRCIAGTHAMSRCTVHPRYTVGTRSASEHAHMPLPRTSGNRFFDLKGQQNQPIRAGLAHESIKDSNNVCGFSKSSLAVRLQHWASSVC